MDLDLQQSPSLEEKKNKSGVFDCGPLLHLAALETGRRLPVVFGGSPTRSLILPSPSYHSPPPSPTRVKYKLS